jgi:hypothetical protein
MTAAFFQNSSMQKETDKDKEKQIQYEAGATILGDPIKFKIPFWFGTRLTLGIRPLKPGTIVRISQQTAQLTDVEESENMIHEMMKAGGNLKIFVRILALAILNHPVKIKLFAGVLSRMLLWRVPSTSELFAYISLVYKRMGAEHFFFIMTLTKGMTFLKKRTKAESTGEDKPSGAPSQLSKKPSN